MSPITISVTLTPALLLAALVYDILLIAAVLFLYRRLRRRDRGSSPARIALGSTVTVATSGLRG